METLATTRGTPPCPRQLNVISHTIRPGGTFARPGDAPSMPPIPTGPRPSPCPRACVAGIPPDSQARPPLGRGAPPPPFAAVAGGHVRGSGTVRQPHRPAHNVMARHGRPAGCLVGRTARPRHHTHPPPPRRSAGAPRSVPRGVQPSGRPPAAIFRLPVRVERKEGIGKLRTTYPPRSPNPCEHTRSGSAPTSLGDLARGKIARVISLPWTYLTSSEVLYAI